MLFLLSVNSHPARIQYPWERYEVSQLYLWTSSAFMMEQRKNYGTSRLSPENTPLLAAFTSLWLAAKSSGASRKRELSAWSPGSFSIFSPLYCEWAELRTREHSDNYHPSDTKCCSVLLNIPLPKARWHFGTWLFFCRPATTAIGSLRRKCKDSMCLIKTSRIQKS